MEKEPCFRILNKTSKTVTVKLMGKPVTFSWEEFNKKLIVVDKVWAVLNEEEKKKQEEADELVNFAVIAFLKSRAATDPGEKLSAMGALGSITKKLEELLECSSMEVVQLVRQRVELMNPFMTNPVFDFRHGDGNHRHTSKNHREMLEKHRTVQVTDEKKPTIGDAFPGLASLKEKMEK